MVEYEYLEDLRAELAALRARDGERALLEAVAEAARRLQEQTNYSMPEDCQVQPAGTGNCLAGALRALAAHRASNDIRTVAGAERAPADADKAEPQSLEAQASPPRSPATAHSPPAPSAAPTATAVGAEGHTSCWAAVHKAESEAARLRGEVERLTRECADAHFAGFAEGRAQAEARKGRAAGHAQAWHALATIANDLGEGENGAAFVAALDAYLAARAGAP